MKNISRLKFTLFDINPDLIYYWQKNFSGEPAVTSSLCSLHDLPAHDCLVSPANSFGIMDGGIDALIRNEIPGVEERVRLSIDVRFDGQQPVGTSILVPGNEKFKFLAHTPTMRTPRPIPAAVVYDVFRALILEVINNPQYNIKTIACPGLGTATGRVSPEEAALYMHLAYQSFSHEIPANWNEVGWRRIP